LGRNGAGLSRPSGLKIRWIWCLERFPWNYLQFCNWKVFRLTPSSTRNVTIFKKKF
jgi:hypothetical protein